MMIDWSRYAQYFVPSEFECKCGCGENRIVPELIELLYSARLVADIPFQITSGYRCQTHNERVGGVSGSAHTQGMAADIYTPTMGARRKILEGLLLAGFTRVGIASTFIHCDVDQTRPRGVYLYG